MSPRRRPPRARPGDAAPPPEPIRPPGRGLAIVAAVAAAAVLVSVTTRIDDPDVWQHLAVGRALWQAQAIPFTHLWTWPSHGAPEVLPSWGFRALLWPFWAAGEVWGLAAWRWLTTLAAFGLAWAAARRMGARGAAVLVVLVLASLTFRLRTQVRPETLVAVLLALQIWILESRRRERPSPPGAGLRALAADRGAWLVVVAWAWANLHISYYLGLALTGIHVLDAWLAARAARGRRARGAAETAPLQPAGRLAGVALACAVVSFANPFGWRALWQPFEYFFVWRHEPIYQTIIELHPIMWNAHWRSGLPVLMLGWPALIAWRSRRHGLDRAEAMTCVLFTALALSAQRFAGLYALAAAPYAARGLDAWIRTRTWPAWTARFRLGIAAAACVAVGLPEWSRPQYPLGIGFDMTQYPARAADFMAEHGVAGRGFNPYHLGGYLLWRFWPQRERLPFMDVHQSGTREDRRLYAFAFANRAAWEALDRRHRFDYALLDGHQEEVRGDRLLDFLDADTTWALVFRDDAAALFVRRGGPLDPVAERFAFRFVPGGAERLSALIGACQADSFVRRWTRAELERQIASSPFDARARSLLATVAWIEGDRQEARAHLRAALERDPRTPGAHQRLGLVALAENRPRDAVREFQAERALGGETADLNMLLARAYRRLGDDQRARSWYRRELRRDPSNAAARESLAVLDGGAR